MNKERVEIFSDGVFAIVMTLLVIEIKVPEAIDITSNEELWHALLDLWPLFASYYFSFFVLSVLWLNHHFFFHAFAKSVDRHLNLMNMALLMFLAFVPFSSHLLGTYEAFQPAALIYGLNILAIILLLCLMLAYLAHHPQLKNDALDRRTEVQAYIRMWLAVACYVLGLVASFFYIPLAIALYVFPMIFNLIPGTLNLTERLFGFRIG